MGKKKGESRTDREYSEYLARTKAFYLYIRDNYERLAEINTEDDLDYTQEIFKSVYEHGMEEGFISWKQKSFVDNFINRITVQENEDDILDRVDPVDFSFDIEEEE